MDMHDDADLGELFHTAFRGLRRTWSEQLAPWDLTPHQWRALLTLLRHTGEDAGDTAGELRLKDVAQRLRIAPRSATEVVDQLQAKGLVVRAADPSDRRATLIRATPAGRALFANVQQQRRTSSTAYFARLSDADRAALARILGHLGPPNA